jgi:peptidoglycan/LPS O-acetylase OafA/YrhL
MAHHQTGQIAGLFADPAALILSGGTSLALYFLPLLFTGLVSIHLLSPLFKRAPVYLLGICFLVALGLHEMCSRHGFDYDMNSTGTGPAPLRLLVCLLEEAVRCSPLIFAAGILTRTLPGPTGRNALPLIVVGALLIVSVRLPGLSGAFEEPAWGIGTFLLAWALSGLIPASHLATLAGLYSFGVYLIHQIFLESIQVLVTPAKPVGVLGILAITMAVYVASMLAVALANRIGSPLVRKIVGLK